MARTICQILLSVRAVRSSSSQLQIQVAQQRHHHDQRSTLDVTMSPQRERNDSANYAQAGKRRKESVPVVIDSETTVLRESTSRLYEKEFARKKDGRSQRWKSSESRSHLRETCQNWRFRSAGCAYLLLPKARVVTLLRHKTPTGLTDSFRLHHHVCAELRREVDSASNGVRIWDTVEDRPRNILPNQALLCLEPIIKTEKSVEKLWRELIKTVTAEVIRLGERNKPSARPDHLCGISQTSGQIKDVLQRSTIEN